MTRTLMLSLAIVSLTACASGGRPGTATKYRPMGLFGGYSDKLVGPNEWQVAGNSNGIAELGFGRNMAMYRAAEVVKAAGFSHFQIVDQKGRARTMRVGGGMPSNAGESLKLRVRGTNDPTEALTCLAKEPEACFTANVDDVLTRLRPLMHLDGPAGQ